MIVLTDPFLYKLMAWLIRSRKTGDGSSPQTAAPKTIAASALILLLLLPYK